MKKKPSIIDLIEKIEVPNIDPEADLKALYYESKYGKCNVSDELMVSIKAGPEDIKEGKVHMHTKVMDYLHQKFNHLKK